MYRTCIDDSWKDNEYRIAKNLLNNIFACYEGWTENILFTLRYPDIRRGSKQLQYPSTAGNGYNILLANITANGNTDLIFIL